MADQGFPCSAPRVFVTHKQCFQSKSPVVGCTAMKRLRADGCLVAVVICLAVHTQAGVSPSAVGRDQLVAVRLKTSFPALTRRANSVKGASAVITQAIGAQDVLDWIGLPAHLQAY